MFEDFIKVLKEWAARSRHIESVILVGSYARGTNKETSDLDLVIITANKAELLETQEFASYFGEVEKKQTEYYGACTSVRVWYKGGQEVEFGIVEPSWIEIPLDSGSHKILSDGYKILFDKKSYFSDFVL